MRHEILEYLYSFKDGDYHELNSFLKSDYGNDTKLFEMRGSLTFLCDKKLIEVANSAHYRLSLPTSNIVPDINVQATLENWIIRAKILDAGKEKIKADLLKNREEIKSWYDTENAKLQYENYPTLKKQAKLALAIAILSLLASIVLGVIALIHR